MFAVIDFCMNCFFADRWKIAKIRTLKNFVPHSKLCFSSSRVVSEPIYDQFMVSLYPVLESCSHKGFG